MARHIKPIEETPAVDILSVLEKFVDTKQAIPNENALYEFVLKPLGFKMTRGEYRYYFSRLRLEGFVEVEPQTRAIKLTTRKIVEA